MRNEYLASCELIDWKTPAVLHQANLLAADLVDPVDIARQCFLFVRDQIQHSWDARLEPVTCSASEVLQQGHGFCYAKSHLLAALLRANAIPAALCYQRLTITDQPPFCLHGLNAAYFDSTGWYRMDARGNKPGVNAQFSPPQEQLAFAIIHPQEADLVKNWSEPMPEVIAAMRAAGNSQQLAENLPDVEVLPF